MLTKSRLFVLPWEANLLIGSMSVLERVCTVNHFEYGRPTQCRFCTEFPPTVCCVFKNDYVQTPIAKDECQFGALKSASKGSKKETFGITSAFLRYLRSLFQKSGTSKSHGSPAVGDIVAFSVTPRKWTSETGDVLQVAYYVTIPQDPLRCKIQRTICSFTNVFLLKC